MNLLCCFELYDAPSQQVNCESQVFFLFCSFLFSGEIVATKKFDLGEVQ